ncbi:MAG TPA: hypothetical protein VED01_19210 [Burkholderiales bacterium]|nr:hypothetical protein [Burkholderiales bacterium]
MRALKAALFLLLAVNTAYFGYSGSASKFTDAAAWLVLLALFQAETEFPRRMRNPRTLAIVRALRLVAGGGVFAAMIGYVFEENALDAVNTVLWIAVVVLLEIELRFASVVNRARRTYHGLLATIYAGLAVLVVLWALRGMWIDAYDAVLWLAAFVMIELAITKRDVSPHRRAPARR